MDINSDEITLEFCSCKQYYHKKCISVWLSYKECCPICKFTINENEQHEIINETVGKEFQLLTRFLMSVSYCLIELVNPNDDTMYKQIFLLLCFILYFFICIGLCVLGIFFTLLSNKYTWLMLSTYLFVYKLDHHLFS